MAIKSEIYTHTEVSALFRRNTQYQESFKVLSLD